MNTLTSRKKSSGQVALFLLTALLILAAITIGWVLLANDTAQRAVFEPVREDIRRNTFENSKAFRDGMVQELRSMQFDYVKASVEHKPGLKQVILHKASSLPQDAVPADLAAFLAELSQPATAVPAEHATPRQN